MKDVIILTFSSIEFLLLFLPIFLIIYGIAPNRMKNTVLFGGSLIFYSFGEPEYLLLLMVSVFVNYVVALRLKSRLLLALALAGNIGVLVYFKLMAGEVGFPPGISFYTFQMMSYLMDVYREEEKREISWVRFATYVTMFPRIMSGPIVRYGEVRSSLRQRNFSVETVEEGLKVFTVGLAAKVLLADRLGLLWQEVQVTGFESISTPLAWLAAVAYSMKIYFDFYGYSIMAIGLGRALGFELPENFNVPYMARSVREFYRRWHMTLGRWFCRYVYIPLGGSRRGELRTVCNLLVVWVLTAVWHGSTPNFLIWGMLLCLLIVFERLMSICKIDRVFRKGILRLIPHLYLWIVIPVSWMCFAVEDVSQLQIYLGRMFGIVEGIQVRGDDWMRALHNYWYLLAAGCFACTPILRRVYAKCKRYFVFKLILVVLFWLCIWRLQVEGQNPFMYFKF